MKNLIYGSSIKGNMHYEKGIECQDSNSFKERDLLEDKINVIALADGHGGTPYFRSSIGSKFAVEIAKKIIYSFVKANLISLDKISDIDELLKKAKDKNEQKELIDLEEKIVIDQAIEERKLLLDEINKGLDLVKDEILEKWNKKVIQHIKKNPFKIIDGTLSKVDSLNGNFQEENIRGFASTSDNVIEMVNSGLSSNIYDLLANNIVEIYGSTLICVASYGKHQFIFQIGDGDVVILDKENNVYFPVKKDENLIGNFTYSICQKNAKDYFYAEYMVCDAQMIMISSDGVINALENELELVNLAKGIYLSIKEEPDTFRKEFKPLLRMFSNGSLDDCTICLIAKNIDDNNFKIIKNSKEVQEIIDLEEKLIELLLPYEINKELYLIEEESFDEKIFLKKLRYMAFRNVILMKQENFEILKKIKNAELQEKYKKNLSKELEELYINELNNLIKNDFLMLFDYNVKYYFYDKKGNLNIGVEERRAIVIKIDNKKIIVEELKDNREYVTIINEILKINIREKIDEVC